MHGNANSLVEHYSIVAGGNDAGAESLLRLLVFEGKNYFHLIERVEYGSLQ